MQQKDLIRLYTRARIQADRSGYPEERDDFASWYAIKLLEGGYKTTTIGQAFIDYLRAERGHEKRARKRYKLSRALRASDLQGDDESGSAEETFERLIARSGHVEGSNPEAALLKRERERSTVGSIGSIRKRELFRLHREGWQLAEIGELFGISESRVSQMLNQLRFELKRKGISLESGDTPEERPDERSADWINFKF